MPISRHVLRVHRERCNIVKLGFNGLKSKGDKHFSALKNIIRASSFSSMKICLFLIGVYFKTLYSLTSVSIFSKLFSIYFH